MLSKNVKKNKIKAMKTSWYKNEIAKINYLNVTKNDRKNWFKKDKYANIIERKRMKF